MNIKKITKKLSTIRDHTLDDGKISDEDRQDLLALVHDTLVEADPSLKEMTKDISSCLPMPDNDNKSLTTEQKFRLRLIEKTGTGSASIH